MVRVQCYIKCYIKCYIHSDLSYGLDSIIHFFKKMASLYCIKHNKINKDNIDAQNHIPFRK